MHLPIITANGRNASPATRPPVPAACHRPAQRGVTLIELMVGIALGLLVVAVAMGALMVSRGVSGTVSDATSIQQQAAYAMRVIGMQLRQAGSLYLNLNPAGVAASNAFTAPVAFETKATAASGASFDPANDTVSAASGALSVGYRRYPDPVYITSAPISLVRNCVGGPADSSVDQIVKSTFQLNGDKLQCAGNGGTAQDIVQHVANFQVRYLLQDNSGLGDSKIQYIGTVATNDWPKVQGVEICLVLYGTEPITVPDDVNTSVTPQRKYSEYVDCDGSNVNINNLSGERARRLHIPFRSVFQLRSQGLLGTVL